MKSGTVRAGSVVEVRVAISSNCTVSDFVTAGPIADDAAAGDTKVGGTMTVAVGPLMGNIEAVGATVGGVTGATMDDVTGGLKS